MKRTVFENIEIKSNEQLDKWYLELNKTAKRKNADKMLKSLKFVDERVPSRDIAYMLSNNKKLTII